MTDQTQAPTNNPPAEPTNPPAIAQTTETPEQKREAMARKRISSLSNAFNLLETGLSLRQVAERLEVPYATLRVWMMDEPEPAYKNAQKTCILYKLAESDEAMEMADTAIAVTRARETLKHSQWLAERRLPHLFAPRQELTGANGAPLVPVDLPEAARRLAFIRAAAGAIDAEEVDQPTTTYSVQAST